MKEIADCTGTFFGGVSFLTGVLSSAPSPPMCLVHLSKCAHAHPLPCTITNNMAWKVCFLESTICCSLGRRKIVLCAESIAICHEWKLMVRRTDIPFAEYDLLSRALTQTRRRPGTCLLPVLPPLNRCVKKRAKEDLTNACPLGGREQGCQCVSYFHEKSFCFLFWKLAEDRNIARASDADLQWGVWNVDFLVLDPLSSVR